MRVKRLECATFGAYHTSKKNVMDNILDTMLDIKEKTKDNRQAHQDL